MARSLRTLDVPVLAAGFAGGRNGDAIRDGLSEAAIPFDLVEIEGYSRTSTAIIDPMAGTQTEINEYGPEVTPAETREFSRRLEYLMEYATAVVFAGSVPPNLDESFLVGLVRRARERGIYTVVDSPPSVLRAVLKANPFAGKPEPARGRERRRFRLYRGRGFSSRPHKARRARGRECLYHLPRGPLLPQHRERHRLGACAQGRGRLDGRERRRLSRRAPRRSTAP